MNFLYDLYQNDNFTLYLTIALVILVILFVVVLVFGKKDQKLEETKRLERIEADSFKEEKSEPVKVEVSKEEPKPLEVAPVVEEKIETPADPYKSFFDETQVMPKVDESVEVTTFKPEEETKVETPIFEEHKEEVKPIFESDQVSEPISLDELPESNTNDTIEIDLSELNSIKNEFDSISVPEVKEEVKEEVHKEPKFKPSPVFSSVYVPNEEQKQKPKSTLFAIEEDEVVDLPSLKTEVKEESSKVDEAPVVENEEKPFSFDDVSGEVYNLKI